MKKIVKVLTLMLVLSALMIIFGGGKVQAADTVTVSRDVYSNNGSMRFIFSGLTLDTENKTYEFGLTKVKAAEVQTWYDVTELTATTATINITATTTEFKNIINTSNKGYITIREKGEEQTIILQQYEVNLKIPYLKVTNFTKIDNGKEFDSGETKCIQVALRNAGNSQASYRYEKVTDTALINKYKEIKAKNGNFNELENMIKTDPPTSNYTNWAYWNGYVSFTGDQGYGYPEKPISAPGEGLYYLWVCFSGNNLKDLYGCILVDNIQPEIKLEGITLPETTSVELGKTLTLTPRFIPSNATNKIVSWESSDTSVATIDNNGTITPKKIGSTIITVTSEDGNKTDTCTVTVVAAGTSGSGSQGSGSQGTGSGSQGSGAGSQGAGTSGTGSGTQGGSTTGGQKDQTTMQGVLPQTGITYVGIFIAIAMVGVGVISFKKYKKYKI